MRRSTVVAALTLGLILAATAFANLSDKLPTTGGATPPGLSREEQERQAAKDAYNRDHTDRSGRVRGDLLRRGIDQFQRLQTSATWSKPASSPTAVTGVTGALWKQTGPAPLRIDANASGGQYQGTGPDSGMVTDIAIDPSGNTDNTLYIGTDEGGIWKTANGGTSWAPLTDFRSFNSIGALALDPTNPSVIYAGTGDPDNNQVEAFSPSVGLYKSIDGGSTWSTVGGAVLAGKGIYRIVVPSADIVLVATTGGLYRSIDGGLNFGSNAPVFDNGAPVVSGSITDLHLDTASPTTIVYAAVSGSGIWKSVNTGQTFTTNLFGGAGAPAPPFTRISFAQSTKPNNLTFYASVAIARGTGVPPYKGLYKSTTGGTSWSRQASADPPAAADGTKGCQCTYDLTVGVDPQDAQRLYLGFQELWLSLDGASTFQPTAATAAKVHWDNHALVFSPASHLGAAPSRLYIGTDGGIATSGDGGTSWTNLNEGIATNLFRAIDIGRGSASNNAYTFGGTQDTGTIEHQPAFTGADWHLAIDGDGGHVAVDASQPLFVYGQDDGTYITTANGGTSWFEPQEASPFAETFRFAVDPNNGAVVYAGSGLSGQLGFYPGNLLFQSTDFGNANTFVLMHTFTGNITGIGITAQDENTLWVSLDNGTVWRTASALSGAASTWTGPLTPPGAPSGQLSSVAVDPTDKTQAVVAYGGFCGGGCTAGNRTKHVFLTTNNGANWADVSGMDGGAQNLPDLPVHSVVIDKATTPHSIIVSTDAGVARSLDTGMTWQRLGVGLPTVDSTSLALDGSAAPALLRVGTYGRSTFELTSPSGRALFAQGDLGFGSSALNQLTNRQLQLFNVGSADLHVSSVTRSAGSAEFTISGPAAPFTISPGQEVDLTIQFQPTSIGDKTATIQIASDDPANPTLSVPASGTGRGVPTGNVVFQRFDGNDTEIWVRNDDGTETRLTNNTADDEDPVFSPDGTKIAFSSLRDGNWEIYVMNADGSNPVNLTNNSAEDDWPTWSPDGTQIAFTSHRNGNYEIYTMNADGTNPVDRTNNSALDMRPAWSPNGASIAFTTNRNEANPGTCNPCNFDIYTMSPTGANQFQVTKNTRTDEDPSFSPDSSKIVYDTNRVDGSNFELFVANADGTGGVTQLTNNPALDEWPSWSPDGNNVVFDSNRDGNFNLFKTAANGTGPAVRLTIDPKDDMEPKWKPSSAATHTANDYDGDGKADVAVFRGSEGRWYIQRSSDNGLTLTTFGQSTDIPVPADYDGDGKTDLAVYRPSEGRWYILRSSDSTLVLVNFGTSTDVPVPADFDGDGKADVAVFRPSEGRWYVRRSSDSGLSLIDFGVSTDVLVPADYDGDGKADAAVYRASEGRWYVKRTSDSIVSLTNFGLSSDVPVPADYDGDGKADIAVFRPSEGRWYVNPSGGGGLTLTSWGTSSDRVEPADYDGDTKADMTVFRPSEGRWYVRKSSDATLSFTNFGLSSDIQLSLPYALRKVFYP